MEQSISLQGYFKLILYLCQLKYIKYFHGTTQVYFWKCNGMAEENIEDITKSAAVLHQFSLMTVYYQR